MFVKEHKTGKNLKLTERIQNKEKMAIKPEKKKGAEVRYFPELKAADTGRGAEYRKT